MRALAAILLLLSACGRLAFDGRTDANGDGDGVGDGSPDAPDIGYFMSPTGDDAAAGTRAAPWRTFTASLLRLVPGDRLNLLDGDYNVDLLGRLAVNCNGGTQNGTATAEVTIRADHPRRAHLFGSTNPLSVIMCSYWTFDGLYIEGEDDVADPNGMVVAMYNSDHITLRGLLVRHPNRHGNNYAVDVAQTTNALIEDVEVYDYHRGAFTDYDSMGTVYRRIYGNGRRAVDAGYTSYCSPGGDSGLLMYYTRSVTLEDAIFEDNCDAGIAIDAGRTAAGDTGVGDNSVINNAIVLGPGSDGLLVNSDCDAAAPCSSPDRYSSGNRITSSVAIGYDQGVNLSGSSNVVDHVTSLGSMSGVYANVQSGGGLSASFQMDSSLVATANVGVAVANQATWQVVASNSQATTPYSPNDFHVVGSTSVDPVLGPCQVYIPDTSPMKGAGTGGTNVGADIRTLVSTGAPAWTPQWAGCGAVVPGVNDDLASSCIGVHQRVSIGVTGCPAP